MKKMKKVLVCVLLGILLLGIAFCAFSHLCYQRSVMATVSEFYLKMNKNNSGDSATRIMNRASNEKYVYDEDLKSDVLEEEYDSMPVYYLNKNDNSPIVIYIHGGAYVNQILSRQWEMVDNIVQEAECEAIVPIYPLAPFHTYEESYELLTGLYIQILEENPNRKITLMGDSAGGGLALGLAESFADANIAQPDELILLSPWVETTETNPNIPPYEAVDPILSTDFLRAAAEFWAGTTDMSDCRISPINGNLSALQNVSIYVGTREMLYPDCTLLAEKLEKENVSVNLTIETGLNHVYPVYPTPEAKKAQKEIADLIIR